MSTCPWEKIDEFRSLNEFTRFMAWMRGQTEGGVAKEVTVASPYAGATTFEERWFMHVESGETWRVVSPDLPFKGVFEPV